MDEVDNIGGVVELIHPARFLFNAGSTPKAWNKKMLMMSILRFYIMKRIVQRFFRTLILKVDLPFHTETAVRILVRWKHLHLIIN